MAIHIFTFKTLICTILCWALMIFMLFGLKWLEFKHAEMLKEAPWTEGLDDDVLTQSEKLRLAHEGKEMASDKKPDKKKPSHVDIMEHKSFEPTKQPVSDKPYSPQKAAAVPWAGPPPAPWAGPLVGDGRQWVPRKAPPFGYSDKDLHHQWLMHHDNRSKSASGALLE